MRQKHILPVLEGWGLEGMMWDRAPSHKAKSLRELPTVRALLPSYSPELNPAERVFEEVRRRMGGKLARASMPRGGRWKCTSKSSTLTRAGHELVWLQRCAILLSPCF